MTPPNWPPKGFAPCGGDKCEHTQTWNVIEDEIPESYKCPECWGLNVLERNPEISFAYGNSTPIKVIAFIPDPDFDS